MIELAEKWKHAENTSDPTFDANDLIDERDPVMLTKDIPGLGLVAGDIGTVVAIKSDGNVFEVEFTTAEGHRLGVETLERSEVRPVTGNSILHVRELESM